MTISITLNGKKIFVPGQARPKTKAEPCWTAKRIPKYDLARSASDLPRSLLQPLRLGTASSAIPDGKEVFVTSSA